MSPSGRRGRPKLVQWWVPMETQPGSRRFRGDWFRQLEEGLEEGELVGFTMSDALSHFHLLF